ncbi:MAG: hypothetical protein ACW98Y_16570 [Candidatus Thorarchaeota archaeon]
MASRDFRPLGTFLRAWRYALESYLNSTTHEIFYFKDYLFIGDID